MLGKLELISVFVTLIFILHIDKFETARDSPEPIDLNSPPNKRLRTEAGGSAAAAAAAAAAAEEPEGGIQVECNSSGDLYRKLKRWIWWYYQEKNDLSVAGNRGDAEKRREFLEKTDKDKTYLLRLPIIEIRQALINKEIYDGRQMNSSQTGIQSHKVDGFDEQFRTYWAATSVRLAQLTHNGNKEVVIVPLPEDAYPPGEAVVTAYYEFTSFQKNFYRVHCMVTGFDLIPV